MALFATVCNRGLRGNHEIFETYQLNDTGNTSEAASLLEMVHLTEKQNGNIHNFYGCFECFGEKLSNQDLRRCGFKRPPTTKDQKVGNCVRASMSAAQKWMANEHDCMNAHKQVKPILLQALVSDITKLSQQLVRGPMQENPTDNMSPTHQIIKCIEQISTIFSPPQEPSIKRLLGDLLDAIACFKEELTEGLSMETPIEESDALIQLYNDLLRELARLSAEHRRAIHEMLNEKSSPQQSPTPFPNPSVDGLNDGF